MMFFVLILLVTGLAWLVSRFGVAAVADWPSRMRWGLSLALIFAGLDHLATPMRYVPMIESFLPWPHAIVFVTGLIEIAGALGLLLQRTRRLAGILLAVYFVAVFPANINNAVSGIVIEGLPQAAWYYWVRLLFQPLVIWWALRSVGVMGRGRTSPTASLDGAPRSGILASK
jgi:uncharacterized membrane protein